MNRPSLASGSGGIGADEGIAALSLHRPRDADRFLSQASVVLAETIDSPAFDRIARLAVPFLADWCAIDVREEDRRFRRVSVAHIEPEKAALAHELQSRFAPDPELDMGYPLVLRTGESHFSAEITASKLASSACSPEHLELMQKLGFRSYMCVPLSARGQTLGAMTFVTTGSRRFTSADLQIAEELGRRAGMALDNGRLLHVAEVARRRAELLARVSRTLATSPEPIAALEEIARLGVPDLGSWVSIRVSASEASPVPRGSGGSVEVEAGSPSEAEVIEVPISVQDRLLGEVRFTPETACLMDRSALLPVAADFAYRIGLAVENARLHAAARTAIHARDELLSVASHELRTPVSALQLMLRVLRNAIDSGRPPEEVARELAGKMALADRQVAHITRTMGRLLDLSRLQANPILDRSEVDVGETAREVIARFEEESSKAGAGVRLHVEQQVVGRFNLFRTEQILTNLLSNAIRHGSGKPVDVEVSRTAAVARIVVRDQGPGIACDEQERIFDRFTRVGEPHTGLGLGLYIVRQIVDEAGGRVSVESRLGNGAAFQVELPLG